MKKNFYITTPIYYASGRLHIGSSSTTLFCDTLKRYKKSMGYDTRFMTGMDEHGQKVEKKAMSKGLTPKEFTDNLATNAKNLWKYLDCDYDYFVRTTDENHIKQVQEVFETMQISINDKKWSLMDDLSDLYHIEEIDKYLKTSPINVDGLVSSVKTTGKRKKLVR